MKKQLYGVFALAALAGIILMLPALGIGQQPGPGGKGKGNKGNKGPGGPGGFNPAAFQGGQGGFNLGMMQGMQGGNGPDPNMVFDRMAKGLDYIDLTTVKQNRDQIMQWAQDNNITSNVLTRDQFNQYFNSYMASMQAGGNGGGPGGRNNAPMTVEEMDKKAVGWFNAADKHGNGYLTEDEMSGPLKQVWREWDTNNDGVISLEEFKAYFRDFQTKRQAGNKGDVSAKIEIDELDRRPTVYRYGHLPPQLPAWFTQYDTDKDGQVGLYEWRRAGQPFDRFQEMDRNGDGLLTAEEVLYYMKLHPEVYGPVNMETDVVAANNGWQQWQPPQQNQKGNKGGGPKGNGGPGGFNNGWGGPQQQQPSMGNNPQRGQGGPGGPAGNVGGKKGKGGGNTDDPNGFGGGKKGKGNKGNTGGDD